MRYVHDDEAWAKKLEEDFDEYIFGCMDSLDYAPGMSSSAEFETVSGEPYCGCSTCYNREVIMFLMPRIIDAYKAGILTEEDNG
jgi:hypothetical protein